MNTLISLLQTQIRLRKKLFSECQTYRFDDKTFEELDANEAELLKHDIVAFRMSVKQLEKRLADVIIGLAQQEASITIRKVKFQN